MDDTKAILDRLPAAGRHSVIVFGGTWGGFVLNRVIDAKGVSAVEWATTLVAATDASFYATAVALVALVVTPLTRQYGLFKTR